MGLTKPRAAQIYNLDYKQATRVVTTTDITLTGGAPSLVDGVSLSLKDRVLVTGQSTGSQNGLYYVTTVGTGSNGTWARTSDSNETGEIEAGMIVMVTEGTTYADTQWKLTTNDPITVGTTALTFVQNYSANSISSGTSNVSVNSNANVTISSAGTANVVNIGNTAVTFASNLLPLSNVTYSLGTTTQRWSNLWLSNSTIYLGNVNLSATDTGLTVNGANVLTGNAGAVFSTSGNVIGGNILTTGYVSATGNATAGNILTVGQASVTGTITTAAGTNSTGFAVGNGAVSNVGLGFFPTAGTRGDYAIRDYSNVTSTIYMDVGMGGTAAGEFQFRTTNAYSLMMRANSSGVYTPGIMSATGRVYGLELNSTQSSGDEGGQINLTKPVTNTTLAGNIIVDVFQNKIRFFEDGGTSRGAYIDITQASAGVGTNLLAGGGGGTPGGSNTYVQFNDGGAFGGNGQFVYNKVTNIVTAGAFAGNTNGTGQNFQVGDDAWIGDINTADTIGIKGQQNGANGYIVFGNSDSTGKLGRAGTGPLTYAGAFSATANITGANILTGGLISATSTITSAANITAGNILTGGLITATGNITGGNLLAGTGVISTSGNITGGNILGGANVNATTHTGTSVSVTGTVTGATISATGAVSGTTITGTSLTVTTGTVTAGNILAGAANLVGTIGNATTWFGNAYVKAVNALYADLAEMYVSDVEYSAGTVVAFGGQQEITISKESHTTQVAGIISTNPSYLMNSAQAGEHVLPVALTGRVPCHVVGTISKGDRLVASNIAGVATTLDSKLYEPGCIIGKSLEDYNSTNVGIIEVAVGRF